MSKGLAISSSLDFEKLMSFIQAIQNGYRNITYHNTTHAADLCQTFNYFLTAGLAEKCALDS